MAAVSSIGFFRGESYKGLLQGMSLEAELALAMWLSLVAFALYF